MSATNRGRTKRRPLDFYETPAWAVHALVPHLPAVGGAFDPAAGNGAILDALQGRGFVVTGADVDPVRVEACTSKGFLVRQADFLADAEYPIPAGLIVTNPPYAHALAFAERAIHLASPVRGTVAMLLRLGFLEGIRRADFHRVFPADVHVLPRRPSFTGGGTDASAYAWFVWGPGRGERWSVLDLPGAS